jgi:hypothetical protein
VAQSGQLDPSGCISRIFRYAPFQISCCSLTIYIGNK